MQLKNTKIRKTDGLSTLLDDERGLTTVEYVIILCLIAVVGFAVWKKFGNIVKSRTSSATGIVETLPTETSE